jgi:hypothetical protein
MNWLDMFKNLGKVKGNYSPLKEINLKGVPVTEKQKITQIYTLEQTAEEAKDEGKYKDAAAYYQRAAKEAGKYDLTKPAVKVYEELAEQCSTVADSKQKSNLELKTIGATTAIVGFIGSAIFLSTNFTGNVIANLNQSSANYMGAGFFLLGLVGLFLCFKKK